MNALYFGDNLDVLRRYIADESVDLIYLDPPFKSDATYNVLFEEKNGTQAAAQIKAFEDTWHWDQSAAAAYQKVIQGGGQLAQVLLALRTFLGGNDMLAYLAMMAIRLKELHRVLKPTGSLYLHCDPTASHYLKLLLDAVFGGKNFRNEIIWKRTHFHRARKRFGKIHDVLFFYTKSDSFTWHEQQGPHDPEYIEKHFRWKDEAGRRFQAITLTGPRTTQGPSGEPWRGIDPSKVGRHWALPEEILKKLDITSGTVQEKLDALEQAGRIYWPRKPGGVPRLKMVCG
ncbi:MAG: DNA methyltransferase [Gemmatales bacterium]|nr:DNA methyltransferase [Gemmatales bacterium]MDW8174450.1 DNA methyltransferase [Gemmatales bacterium]